MNRARKKKIANSYFYLQFDSTNPPLPQDGKMWKSAVNVSFFFFFFTIIRIQLREDSKAFFIPKNRYSFSFFTFLDEKIHAWMARVDKFEDATQPRAFHPLTVTRFSKGSGNCHEITRKLMQRAFNAWTRYHILAGRGGLPSFSPFFLFNLFLSFFLSWERYKIIRNFHSPA